MTFKQADVFYLVGGDGVVTGRSFSNTKAGRDCDLSDGVWRRHQSAAINELRSARRCCFHALLWPWRTSTAGGTVPADSSVHRHPSARCPGLCPGTSQTSAAGTDTLCSSPGMGSFCRADPTLRAFLDGIRAEMEGRQVNFYYYDFILKKIYILLFLNMTTDKNKNEQGYNLFFWGIVPYLQKFFL